MSDAADKGVRLNRFLASCGVASRRACDAIIQEGRVEVNGRIVVDLSTRVAEGDQVRCDGKPVRGRPPLTVVLNKPRKYICTRSDPEGRETVYRLLPKSFASLHYIGRLDYNSSGLLLLTSSGELTERLSHPRHQVEKEYEVLLERPFEMELAPKLLEGLHLEEGLARAESVERLSRRRLRIVLTQGYNRQIRRMLSKVGHKVTQLERVRIGSLVLPELAPGDYQILTHKEIEAVSTNPAPKRPAKRRPRENR
jgi:pseudouridine synthase